jgi:toxin-antitoxin system PIN domain toxin
VRALFDVNVLLALFDRAHTHQSRALEWSARNRRFGWASCPLTQNGFVRISCQPGYARPALLPDALAVLGRQLAEPDHEFWPDDICITDAQVFDHTGILSPNQITDVYLLALAVKNGGRLVTFDRGVPIRAVRGAGAEHLVVI